MYPIHYYYKQAFSWHLGELYGDLLGGNFPVYQQGNVQEKFFGGMSTGLGKFSEKLYQGKHLEECGGNCQGLVSTSPAGLQVSTRDVR